MKKHLTVEDIRKAVDQLRRANARTKEVKYYKGQIRNWPLFYALLKAGKIKQTRPNGPWELT